MGISVSASSLAINTYFKTKRRKAAGFSWTITGLGPIVLPHLATFLMTTYGVQGTVFIFAAISLHSAASALVYQPVRYHAKKHKNSIMSPNDPVDGNKREPERLCQYCELQKMKQSRPLASIEYLCKDDDEDNPGFEITEPGTPMLSRANDGYFGRSRTVSTSKDMESNRRLRKSISEDSETSQTDFYKPNNFNRQREDAIRNNGLSRQYGNPNIPNLQMRCTCSEERVLMDLKNQNNDKLMQKFELDNAKKLQQQYEDELEEEEEEEKKRKLNFFQKVVAFFDLSLLKDFTYVNLVFGLTIINFGEINFSILTPFILNDFGFTNSQTTMVMSILAIMDITVRFLVPFFTEKVSWDNRVFFLIGVVGIALGRTVVASTRSFNIILGSFVWIGICKGIRTIFWPLIIPAYVPLKRLPAASGLQLLISGLFTMSAGPFVGMFIFIVVSYSNNN